MHNAVSVFSANFVEIMDEKKTGAKLMGSWTVMIGDQDEAIHLWKYKGGYPAYNQALMAYRTDPVCSIKKPGHSTWYFIQITIQ